MQSPDDSIRWIQIVNCHNWVRKDIADIVGDDNDAEDDDNP